MNDQQVAKFGVAVECWDIPVIVGYPLFIVVFFVVVVKQLSVLVYMKIYLGMYSDFYGVYVFLLNILYNVLYDLVNL